MVCGNVAMILFMPAQMTPWCASTVSAASSGTFLLLYSFIIPFIHPGTMLT